MSNLLAFPFQTNVCSPARPGVSLAASMRRSLDPRTGDQSRRSRSIGIRMPIMPGSMLAKERGYFAAAGIDLDIYTPSDPTTVLQTVGAGKDDFGISYQTDVLLARAQGVPVVSIAALVQHPLVVIMTLEENRHRPPARSQRQNGRLPRHSQSGSVSGDHARNRRRQIRAMSSWSTSISISMPAMISGQVDAVMGAFLDDETSSPSRRATRSTRCAVEEWGVPDYYELVLVASDETVAKRAGFARSILERGPARLHRRDRRSGRGARRARGRVAGT